LRIDPRTMLAFEDAVHQLPDPDDPPPGDFHFALLFAWRLGPLPDPPDLLVLATELAGLGGMELPIEVSAVDSFATVTDPPERSLSIVGRVEVSLADLLSGERILCETLDRCRAVSLFLLDRAPAWLGEG
jgi:hypothetical protein